MWKESYQTGIERIDFQHKSLFDKCDELLHAIEQGAGPYVYAEIINFLKGYVVFHFRDEEAYQRSVNYSGYEAHKKAHASFAQSVAAFDRILAERDYPLALVKELAGTLTAWLIYHVAYTDQKIASGENGEADSRGMTTMQIITASMCDTLHTLTGLSYGQIKEYDAATANFAAGTQVDIDLFGDVNGTLSFVYSDDAAKSLFEDMTMQRPQSIDEMVCSALSEITNIATGNTTIRLSGNGVACDIRTPKITEHTSTNGYGGIVLDIGSGKLKISASLDHY